MTGLNDRLTPGQASPHSVLPTTEHSASTQPNAHGSIHAVYPNAISFMDEQGAMEGYLTILGAMVASFPIWAFYSGPEVIEAMPWFAGFLIAALFLSLLMIRADTIAYRYQPVLFNRATGKVHVFVAQSLTWWKLWQLKPPCRIETWDWDCIRAEVVEVGMFSGSGAPRKDYGLVGAAVEPPGSLTVVGRFIIGLAYSWYPQPMFDRWEHIRLYMRHEGPPIRLGDHLFHDASTHRFWTAFWFGQPLLGPGSRKFWTGEFLHGWWFLTIPGGMTALPLLPFTIAAGLLRWLSHKVKREPKWPPEILATLGGPVLSLAELNAQLSTSKPTWTQRRKALKQQRKNN